MYALGISKLKWALLKDAVVVRTEEGTEIPEEVLSIKNLKIVTALPGSSVIRRDLKLPVESSMVRKALPFQLEPLLPFPLDQTVLYIETYPSGKETFVVVWAAPLADELPDSDLISCETLALSRWARHFYPDEPQLVVLHENLAIALDHGRTVCAMESSDPARLRLFLKQKYPLFSSIEPDSPFAIEIGLALEAFQKKPCQFRPKNLPSPRQKTREKSLLKRTLYAGGSLTFLTAVISMTILQIREFGLKNQIPNFKGSLEEATDQFRSHLMKETKNAPAVYMTPPVKDVLAWISALTTPAQIEHIEYELQGTHATLQLEFKAQDPDQFIKQLQQSPTFVDSTQDLKWTSHSNGYKTSFQLRSRSG